MNIKSNMFKFLFILIIFFSISFAQSDEEIKISSYALEPFCNNFWSLGWNSNYILSQNNLFVKFSMDLASLFEKDLRPNQKIYSPYLRYTIDSLYLDAWSIQEKDITGNSEDFLNFQKEKNTILKGISDAKEAKKHLNLLNNIDPFFGHILTNPLEFNLPILLGDNVLIINLLNPLNFTFDIFNFLVSFYYSGKGLEWSNEWDLVMEKSSSALFNCASGLNSIFLAAQSKALNLYEEGIEQEGYISESKEAYIEWKNFVKNVKSYVKNKKQDSTIYSKYALAYLWSENINKVCKDPPSLPVFSPYSSVAFIFNQSCSLDDSLLSYALSMNHKLDKANEILEKDLEASYSKASNTKSSFLDLQKDLISNEPLVFAQDDFFASRTQTLKVVNFSGSIDQLYNQVFVYSDLAQEDMKFASSKIPKVNKILLYQNATAKYLKAIETINQLNSIMSQKTDFACQQAQKEVNRLENSINSQKTSSNTNYTKLALLTQSYNSALSYLEDSQKELKLGKKFSLCQKAYLAAIYSDETANNAIISNLLNSFKEYILAGEKIGADVSEYRQTYEAFSSLFKSNYDLDPQDIQSNILSIKNYLNSFLEKENNLYQKIVSLLTQVKTFNNQLYSEFFFEISKYRDKDGWSLYAFKNREKLNSFLDSFDKKLNKELNSYLSNKICQNAKFYPINYAPAYTASSIDIGGSWESFNPLSISVSNLNISCDFDYPFSYSSIKAKSENIQKIALNSKQLIIYFDYLGAGEKIFISFSENAIPVNIASSSCNLFIQSNNLINLDANYTLNSLYAGSTILNISWGSISDSIVANAQSSDMAVYPGTLRLNKNTQKPQVEFLVPLQKGKNIYHITISSNIKRNFDIQEQVVSSPKPGVYSYSYKLVLKDLAYCDNIYLERKENSMNISNLKIESLVPGYQVDTKDYSSSGGFWSIKIKRLSSSAQPLVLKVYYEFSDPISWFNSNYYNLLSKANQLNNSYSLSLLEKAKIYASNNDFTNAIKKIQEADKYLLDLEINKDKHKVLSSKIEELTTYLNSLENFSSTNSTLNNKILKLKSNIKSSIQTALSKSNLDVDEAILYLEKSIASLNSDIDKEFNSLLAKLEKNLDNLSSYAFKNNIESESLTNASEQIKLAKKYLNENKNLDALLALYSASVSLEKASQELNTSGASLLEDLISKKSSLENKFSSLSEDLTKYLEDAKLLESKKTLFKPKLSSKDAQSILKSIAIAFKGWQDLSNASFDKVAAKLEQNQNILENAANLYSSASAKHLEAKNFLSEKAETLLDKAKIKAASITQEDKKSDLLAKISNAENLIKQEKYANAILELSDVLSSKLEQSAQSQENNFPIFEILITIVFVAAIIYVILKSKPNLQQSKTNLKNEPKTLKKAQPPQPPENKS